MGLFRFAGFREELLLAFLLLAVEVLLGFRPGTEAGGLSFVPGDWLHEFLLWENRDISVGQLNRKARKVRNCKNIEHLRLVR